MKTWKDKIKGLSRKGIRARFPDAPDPMTAEWCETWLWWWRAIPAVAANGWKRDGLKPVELRQLAMLPDSKLGFLRELENAGGVEAWLRECEKAEYEARGKGRGPAGPDAPIRFHGEASPAHGKTYSLDGLKICDADSRKDVHRIVEEHLVKMGWKPGTGRLYKASRRANSRVPKKGEKVGWVSIFAAVEAIDRGTLLNETLSDGDRRTISLRITPRRRKKRKKRGL